MTFKSNFINTSVSGVSSVLKVFFAVVRVKFVAIFLGPSGVGILGQITSFNTLISIFLTLGTSNGFIREVSRNHVGKNSSVVAQFMSTFFLVTGVIGLVAGGLSYIFSNYLSEVLLKTNDYFLLIQINSMFLFLLGVNTCLSIFLAAFKQVKALAIQSVTNTIISSLITILLIYIWGLEGSLYALVLGTFIDLSIGIFLFRRSIGYAYFDIRETFKQFRIRKIYDLAGYSAVALVPSFVFHSLHIGIKGNILEESGEQVLGVYQAMVNIPIQYLPVFVSSLYNYLLPKLSGSSSDAEFGSTLNHSIRSISILSVGVLIILMSFSRQLLYLLYTDQFVSGAPLLDILVIASFLSILYRVHHTALLAKRKLQYLLWIDLISFGCFYFPSIIFYSDYGLKGIVLFFLIQSFVQCVFTYVLVNRGYYFEYSKRNKLFLSLTLVTLVSIAVLKYFLDWMICGVVGIIVTGILYATNLNTEEKKDFVNILKKIKNP